MKANGTTPSQHALPVVILGTDAAFAAAPATPVQLAHACLRAGFASVIPSNWGDELVAARVMRRLADRGPGPAIQCTCPIVAHRLLSASGDLRHMMVPLVAPPVAVARYIRAVSHPTPTRITYVGACPGALDDSIDIRMTPVALLELLAERQIVPADQPQMFESVLPPDRRRYWSQPGGLPSPEVLWRDRDPRALIEITSEDIPTELAQHLLSGKTTLIDASARLGCVCSGSAHDVPPLEARLRVTTIEPPRAAAPIIEDRRDIELDLPVPAVSRWPVDVVAAVDVSRDGSRPGFAPPAVAAPAAAPTPADAPAPLPNSPPRGIPVNVESRVIARGATPPSPRPVLGGVPVARDGEGRTLPRAYVARRRPSPKNTPVVPSAPVEPGHSEKPRHASAHAANPSVHSSPRPVVASAADSVIAHSMRPAALGTSAQPAAAYAEVPEERAVALATTAEPASGSSAPAAMPSTSDPTTTSREVRIDRGVDTPTRPAAAPRDPAPAPADQLRRPLQLRAGLIILFLAAVVASTAVGVVIGHWFDSPARGAVTPSR